MDAKTSQLLTGYLTEKQLADNLGQCVRTVARWRRQGIGPPHSYNGIHVIYPIEGTHEWLAAGGTRAASIKKRTRVRRTPLAPDFQNPARAPLPAEQGSGPGPRRQI
jgi:hypothetical protein